MAPVVPNINRATPVSHLTSFNQIHFNSVKHDAPGIYADRAHLLDTVINNIEMMNDYYKKSAIPFTVREMDMFFNVYETNGYVQRNKSDNIELIDK